MQTTYSPWYTGEITQVKKERRRCEKQWRDTDLTVHYQIYIKQRTLVKWMITHSKRSFFKDKIEGKSTNPRALFTIIKNVLHRKAEREHYLHTHLKRLKISLLTSRLKFLILSNKIHIHWHLMHLNVLAWFISSVSRVENVNIIKQ